MTADPARVEGFLAALAEIGTDARGGWSRLAFGEAERQAHALFTSTLKGYGITATTDAVGNTIGVLPGGEPLPALVTGSHLDTVYEGGNYDGAAGVAVAVEVARVLAEDGGLRHPFWAVAFAAEEGARFGAPCIGSRLITGSYGVDTLKALVDKDGRTAFGCAQEVGLRPDLAESARWGPDAVKCFVEVHIEQGRVLEARERGLGVVHSIGGSTRLELAFSGRADHSGATPMWLRRDALVAAAEFVLAVDRRARMHATTVATVGRLDVSPNSLTTVPGHVLLTLDVRDTDSERQRELTEELLDDAVRIGGGCDVAVSARELSDQSPVVLHSTVQDLLAGAAGRVGLPFISMPSGASHDAAHLAKHFPTGMLFVPCRDGISHSPVEHAEPQAIASAVDVLVEAFRAVDADAVV
jgi:allantoate deiminase